MTIRKDSVRRRIAKGKRNINVDSFESSKYWEERYVNGGNSGNGSYGMLANYKKDFINNFILKNNIKSLLEYGCGDCNQLNLIECDNIIGVDVSKEAIELCNKKIPNHKFFTINKNESLSEVKIDLVLSLDVLYHLIEDDVYENYITNLVSLNSDYIIIYSCNFEDDGNYAKHVKPRNFTKHPSITENYDLIHFEKNKYNEKQNDMNLYSNSDWFIYMKK